jgi:peptidyl-dipeptidase Dcp
MHNPTLMLVATVAVGAVLCTACNVSGPTEPNPLLGDWDTPFGAPPFDQIQEEHFLPAFEASMEAHTKEVALVAGDAAEPTFANTVEVLERSGELLERTNLVFINLNEAHSSDGLQELAKEINPRLSAHQDDILLDEKLFERVKAVYDSREGLDLTIEQQRLLDKSYRAFVRGGANLDGESKVRLREINGKLASLTTQFGDNLLKEMNAVALLIEDEADLAGLTESVRSAAQAMAKEQGHEGAWAFNLQRTSWTPFMQLSERRELREKLYRAYTQLAANGGETDNRELAAQIAVLRGERARLLGYESHAAYVLEENMAEVPARVNELLEQLWAPALARATVERDELQALADSLGDDIDFSMWDWWFYAEKLRAAKYDFDEASVKPYLELESVRQAAFDVAGRLWGLTFEERPEITVWHPDVRTFEVKDADGSHLGLLYVDYFARASKRGGAWMENFRQQWEEDGRDVRPIIVNVCNFSKPAEGEPALLSLDEALTVFHEFGHALHGLLADGTYSTLSGTNVAQDFVELPSQMMENWALAPEVLPAYARHVKSGEPIPPELVEKLQRAKQFNQGFATTEYLAASILDMDWHSVTGAVADAMDFEAASMDRIGIIPEVVTRYRTPYFGHIFSGGYSAGYYSYVWAEVLDADGFEAFKEAGLFDPTVARFYRENILSAGDSEAPMVLYERFRGAKPSIEPLLARRGLQ